jgi:hypothetical protein
MQVSTLTLRVVRRTPLLPFHFFTIISLLLVSELSGGQSVAIVER